MGIFSDSPSEQVLAALGRFKCAAGLTEAKARDALIGHLADAGYLPNRTASLHGGAVRLDFAFDHRDEDFYFNIRSRTTAEKTTTLLGELLIATQGILRGHPRKAHLVLVFRPELTGSC